MSESNNTEVNDLADDVDATIGRIVKCIQLDSEEEIMTPMGVMTEAELIGFVRPMLEQWVRENADTALKVCALIHKATGDIMEYHAPEEDTDQLAKEALER